MIDAKKSNMEDLQCIERIFQGESDVYQEIVVKYQDLVFSLCLRMLHEYEEALDLSQDIFIKVFQNLPKYKTSGLFYSWLYRLALNQIRDYLRSSRFKKRQKEQDIVPFLNNNAVAYKYRQPDEELVNNEIREKIEREVAALPEKQREVFILHYFHNLSIKEIKDINGQSLSNIKVLLFRARKVLASCLKGGVQ